jgi:phosphatidylserine/phosphatidylglycerophosphate/cardiolipin synthase-like enzyme
MTLTELLGGVLFSAPDLEAATLVLTRELINAEPTSQAVRTVGLDPELVDAIRPEIPTDAIDIAAACRCGAAWVQGRRSVPTDDSWEPVLSVPPGSSLPHGVRRTTGETLVGLVAEAHRTLRFVAPFFDQIGARYLAGAIAAATARGVNVQLYLPPDAAIKAPALAVLREALEQEGVPKRVRIVAAPDGVPWPHLKVMVSDGIAAYVGSANVTGPGLGGRNLEFGVLVRGPQARVIDRVLDLIPGEATPST